MKTSMNFYAPVWLLVLGLAFGLFSCQNNEEDSFRRPEEARNGAVSNFVITDLNGYNLIKSREDTPYDVDYIHLVMHDGTVGKDFKYDFSYGHHHPAANGCVFRSGFLAQIILPDSYDLEYQKPQYLDKDFYLVLNEVDTDTLRWNSKENRLYHNGKIAPESFMIMKENY